ncbi:MAG: CHAT domain-containing protein [Sphingobacteriaceae bacterium]|nr:MAG: CHAT domain-containing protein [Sphingobacteriaceae bacterium]
MGDVWVTRHQPLKALTCYQQAINYLLFDFNSADIYTDPASFNSAFYTTELMETLLAKAEAFTLLYSTSHRVKDLDASLQTFLSFYRLTGFIEQFYESDDARMFISIKKNASHRQPIALCLQLFKLTGNKKYIEQAFLLDEQNKANTLALYLQENKLKASSNISASLLAEESYLKRSITAIVLKASGIANMKVLTRLKDTLNQYTVRLIKVQDKINNHTRLKKLNLGGNSISITELQKIIPGDGIILSYHIGDKEILGFAVTKDEFNFFSKPVDQDFQPSLQELYKLAQLAEGNNNRTVKSLSANLYRQLIQPAETWLKGKTNLIIIPDDELNYLPFELLTDNKGANLLSHYSITYNYSCTLLHQKTGNIQYSETKKLGMAPFNGKIPEGNWVQLSSSKQEIESVNGTMLLNRQATKQHFLQQAHNYGIIHLATHAYANDHDPNRSFIAFYPEGKVMDHELFLPEIYNLKLDKTRLIILSACQTGTGELVKGEGLMSLSRAFSYAGCDNIITSSWMANDNATAYIASRLHYYLQKNYGIAHALQQAKTDYLQDESIPATLKKPAYWAHLRLIGGFETEATTNWVGYAGFVIGLIVLILIVQISRNRVKRPRPGA